MHIRCILYVSKHIHVCTCCSVAPGSLIFSTYVSCNIEKWGMGPGNGAWERGYIHKCRKANIPSCIHTPFSLPSPSNCTVYAEIVKILDDLARKRSLPHIALLTEDVHVLPDFIGNRSPLADPTVSGLVRQLKIRSLSLSPPPPPSHSLSCNIYFLYLIISFDINFDNLFVFCPP